MTRSSLNCSSRWAASATSAIVPAAGLRFASSLFEDLLGEPTAFVGRPDWSCAWAEVPVLLFDRADMSHDLGLEPLGIDVGVQRSDLARRSVLPARDDADRLGVVETDADRLAASVSGQVSPGSLSTGESVRDCSTNAGRGPRVRASPTGLFESSAATQATAPRPAVRKTIAKTAVAVIRNLLRNMVLSTPLTSVCTDAETSPAVIQSDKARTALRTCPRGTAARATSTASVAPSPAEGARPSRISRSRSRSRPRKRQLLTVPTGRPIRRAASSQVKP